MNPRPFARSLPFTAALLLAARLFAAESVLEDWPQFLGPRADGTSRETGLLDKFPVAGPSRIWEREIGTGYSAPSVRDGLLVIHHRIKNEEVVEAFDAATGVSAWKYGYPTAYTDPFGYNNGPRASPLLAGGGCYTFGAEGKLVCLELKTGKLLWQRDTSKDFDVPEAFFGVGSTPVLENERLIVPVGGQPDAGVVAFDARTGKTLWKSVGKQNWEGQPMIGWPGDREVIWRAWEKQASYATPVVATVNGERVLFALMRQGLVALNPTNGAVHFSRWFRAQVNESVNAANPVVVGNSVFCSAAYYGVGSFLLDLKPGNKAFTQLWAGRSLEIHWTTPVYHDGFLYAFSGRNEPDASFRCVDYKSGKLAWERDESWPSQSNRQPPVYGRGSAILADGKLIVLGEGGLLGLVRANPKKFEELARWQVPSLRYPCWAAPVLSHKKLYLRSEDRLLCLNFAK
jgi:outer membrane protein assembly factor BamB